MVLTKGLDWPIQVLLIFRSSLSPTISGKMLSSISYNNDSYKDPCDDVKPEQQQSSL